MHHALPITYVSEEHFLRADALFAVILGHQLELDVSEEFSFSFEGAFLEFTETGLFRAARETTTNIEDLADGITRLAAELDTLITNSSTLTETLRYVRARDGIRAAAVEAGVRLDPTAPRMRTRQSQDQPMP